MYFDDEPPVHVSNAYAHADRSRAALRETTRVLVLVLSALVNLIFIISGIARPLGLYSLLVYCLFIYLLLSAAAKCGTPERCDVEECGAEYHAHSLGYSTALRTTVIVWIAWFVACHLMFEADLLYVHSHLFVLPLFCASAATIVLSHMQSELEGVASHAFVVAFLLSLAFPSPSWTFQTAPSVSTVLRVALYFVLATLIDIYSEQHTLVERDIASAVPTDATQRESRLFCATMRSVEYLAARETRRTRRVVAQSAWVLVTSGTELCIFGLGLLFIAALTHGNLYRRFSSSMRRSPAQKPDLHTEVVSTPDIEAQPLPPPFPDAAAVVVGKFDFE